MTITTQDTRQAYATNGASVAFAVPWPFYGPDELQVFYTADGGDAAQLIRGTDYTVLGGSGGIGTVTTTSALAAGTLVILRDTTPTQQVAFIQGDPLPAATVERTLDRAAAMSQERITALLRTLRVPAGEADLIDALPSKTARASKYLAFDANGQPTALALGDGTVAISAAMVPVATAATLASARLILGGRQHVNAVKDAGVDNTGATDTAAALAAAIAAMTSGVLYLPPGTYKLGSDVPLKPGVTLIGEDPLLTTLVAAANGVKLLTYTASATQNHFTIRRIGFSGGGFSSVYGIHIDGTDSAKRCSLVQLEDLYLSQLARGADLKFCANSFLERMRAVACGTALYIDQCADTEIMGGSAQNGSGWGIDIYGGAGAFDEGCRISHYTTNGQAGGVRVIGQDFGQITGCSFTTASLGAAAFQAATNWKMSNSDFYVAGGTPANPGITADASSAKLTITGNLIGLNTFGINLLGTGHTVTGNNLEANSNVDINLQCTKSSITGNRCDSTGVAASIVEQAGSDYNSIYGNPTNGTVTIVGANTKTNGDNLVY